MRRRSSKLTRASTRSAARQLIRELPSLLKLLFRLMIDRRVPAKDKALFALVAAYVISPLDLIPDFGGLLGLVDDLYLVGLSLGRLMASAGEDILMEHWDGDARSLGFLIEGVESLGGMLPEGIRNALGTTAVTGGPPRKAKPRSRSGFEPEEAEDEPRIHRVRHARLKKRPRPEPDHDEDDE
ncbi:MAG: YkvA family protein [Longimicrobiales bacterium]